MLRNARFPNEEGHETVRTVEDYAGGKILRNPAPYYFCKAFGKWCVFIIACLRVSALFCASPKWQKNLRIFSGYFLLFALQGKNNLDVKRTLEMSIFMLVLKGLFGGSLKIT